MMLRLFRRNPFLRTPLYLNPIQNGAASNSQTDLSPFIVFYSSAASNLPRDSAKTKDPVFDFFHSYGFTDPQIRRFLHKSRSVRSTEILKPKLEHLLAFGLSPSDLIRTICYYPTLLDCSLKNRIEPNLELLEATLGSKTNIIKAIVHGPWLLTNNLEKHVIPNLKILENTIPMDNVIRVVTTYPRVLIKDPKIIIETISKLKELGMSPSTVAFAHGMSVMATYKKETWERKVELYRSLGWSEKDTLSVFSTQPSCLALSDDKIKAKMKFFKEKLQWDSAILAKGPVLLLYSMEGRIIPRCSVLDVLAKRKLWNGKPSLLSVFYMSEKKFEETFVEKHGKEVPQMIDAYKGKVDFEGFESMDVVGLKS